jgi:hypothetical protein
MLCYLLQQSTHTLRVGIVILMNFAQVITLGAVQLYRLGRTPSGYLTSTNRLVSN